MAKTRRRSGAAPGAPRPKIEPRKTPWLRRRWVRWTPVAVLVILAAILTPMLLGNAARADRLRAYDRALLRAILPFQQHQAPTSPDSFASLPEQFGQGTVAPQRLEDVATTWAEDFTEAASNVRALVPPDELEGANVLISQALDHYAGVARDYVVLADQQRLADGANGKAKRQQERQVSAWLVQIGAARTRAETQLGLGRQLIDDLKVAWGVSPPPAETDLDDLQIPPGVIPDGGLQGG